MYVSYQIHHPSRKMTPFMAQSESHLKFNRKLRLQASALLSFPWE